MRDLTKQQVRKLLKLMRWGNRHLPAKCPKVNVLNHRVQKHYVLRPIDAFLVVGKSGRNCTMAAQILIYRGQYGSSWHGKRW